VVTGLNKCLRENVHKGFPAQDGEFLDIYKTDPEHTVFQIAAPEEGGCFKVDRGFKVITIDYDILQGRSNQDLGGIKGCWDLKRAKPGYRCLEEGRRGRTFKYPHVKLNPKHDYKCTWWQIDHGATQMEMMEKDTEFPEHYKEIFRDASVGTFTELDSVENLHFPEEKMGCTVPVESRVSFPDRRDQKSLEIFKGGKGAVWFEHMQKAAGTSFCLWARKNMGYFNVPKYACMVDGHGRLGSITADEDLDRLLNIAYIDTPGAHIKERRKDHYTIRYENNPREQHHDEKHITKIKGELSSKHSQDFGDIRSQETDGDPYTGIRMLANEWDTFPSSEMEPLLRHGVVFATILRDPLDRSLSAYNFFHGEHHPVGDPNHKNFMDWLAERGDMANYYCRKLSKSEEMHSLAYVSDGNGIWRWNYEDARKVLSQFHFLQILEFLSDYGHEPFEYIGWKFDDSRKNAAQRDKVRGTSKAVAELGQDAIRVIIQENYYDILLYQYAVKLFVERSNGCHIL
jgi:hypothetical protein